MKKFLLALIVTMSAVYANGATITRVSFWVVPLSDFAYVSLCNSTRCYSPFLLIPNSSYTHPATGITTIIINTGAGDEVIFNNANTAPIGQTFSLTSQQGWPVTITRTGTDDFVYSD